MKWCNLAVGGLNFFTFAYLISTGTQHWIIAAANLQTDTRRKKNMFTIQTKTNQIYDVPATQYDLEDREFIIFFDDEDNFVHAVCKFEVLSFSYKESK